MASTFSRTLRSIQADAARRRTIGLLIAIALVAGWGAWFFFGDVAVYEVTDRARLEVEIAAHPIQARVAGQLIETRLTIGREVEAGEVIAELDAKPSELLRAEARAQLEDLRARLTAKRAEIRAEEGAASAHREASAVAIAESRARISEAEAVAQYAEYQAKTTGKLGDKGLVPEETVRQTQADADAKRAAVRAIELLADRLPKDQEVEQIDRRARIAKLEREAVELEGLAAIEEATIKRLDYEIELHRIRAPIAGRIGESCEIRAGSVLEPGDKLGSVVPPGEPRAVAFFPAAAVGRIRTGQPARLRLEGFPWTRYGTLTATVAEFGNEATDGRIRVELSLDGAPATSIPREHGLPGSAEVEVERISPAGLVLRGAARILAPRRSPPPIGSDGEGEP